MIRAIAVWRVDRNCSVESDPQTLRFEAEESAIWEWHFHRHAFGIIMSSILRVEFAPICQTVVSFEQPAACLCVCDRRHFEELILENGP